MQSSSQIISEIQKDASALQLKLLTLQGVGETINEKQENAIDKAQEGLLGWRSWDLGELEKAFAE